MNNPGIDRQQPRNGLNREFQRPNRTMAPGGGGPRNGMDPGASGWRPGGVIPPVPQ